MCGTNGIDLCAKLATRINVFGCIQAVFLVASYLYLIGHIGTDQSIYDGSGSGLPSAYS